MKKTHTFLFKGDLPRNNIRFYSYISTSISSGESKSRIYKHLGVCRGLSDILICQKYDNI